MTEPLSEGQVRLTVEHANGEVETTILEDSFVVVTAGDMHVTNQQWYGNGTQVITIKRQKEVDRP